MSTSFSSTILVCALATALLGCGGSSAPVITTPTAMQVKEFTRNAGITLPASAQPVSWRELRGMDDALWLQVRMPATEVAAFLASSPFSTAKLATNDQSRLYNFQDFWQSPPQRHRSGQESLPNARVLNIVIDDSDATNAVVYLMWHET